ncbi:MAG: DUF3422 family protein [Geminicoccaceae bacterium]
MTWTDLTMPLPPSHPDRFVLANEVHARPPEALTAPVKITYLALFSDRSQRETEWRRVVEFAKEHGASPPKPDVNHYSENFGSFRLKWERHAEFSRYKFMVQENGEAPFEQPAIRSVPGDWVASIPGEVMAAAQVAIRPADRTPLDHDLMSTNYFAGNSIIGAVLSGGAAAGFTDFRIHEDGFSRFLIEDRGTTPRQAGRLVQRILEIDTYRVMAMLALPVARKLMPLLDTEECELTEISNALVDCKDEEEPKLLDRLTQLQAKIESDNAENHFRFSAAAAYYDLVQRRIVDLREERIQGLQTFHGFIDRRLAPAMNTCMAVRTRQENLSSHMARATQLLSTRVNIANERQNQGILASMNRRALLQMRLQETVEGLSIAAITYYVVGLVSYLAKGAKASGLSLNVDLVTGISIPIVLIIVALGVRKIRKMVAADTT